jgi:hypothetical protein
MDLELTAYHEAGHAVAAVVLGARVRLMTLEPEEPDDGPPRMGETQVAWKPGKWPEREYRERASQVALAGPVAEMLYSGDPYHPGFVVAWTADWRAALELASGLWPTEAQRIEGLEGFTRAVYRWLDAEPQWSAVAALADELLAQETLEREAIHEIVRQWIRVK